MILVTVGGQLGFDRLVRTVDEWAGEQGRQDVFCQILDGSHEPTHCAWERTLPSDEFQARLREASLIVAHAGMGTIITALEQAKPVLIMPRRAKLGEHRNDHQLATAERFRERGQVLVAMDEAELLASLADLDHIQAGPPIADHASPELLDAIREFIRS